MSPVSTAQAGGGTGSVTLRVSWAWCGADAGGGQQHGNAGAAKMR
jgi:hypothetical protein